jgi:Peptidase S24-like
MVMEMLDQDMLRVADELRRRIGERRANGVTQTSLGVTLGKSSSWAGVQLLGNPIKTIRQMLIDEPARTDLLASLLGWDSAVEMFKELRIFENSSFSTPEAVTDGPPSSLEYIPDGAYIRLRGRVSGGNGDPEELTGDLFFVPRHILKKYNITNPDRELGGYMVNGDSMFYASDNVRARGLKNGDLIAVHRFLAPTAETPMVVAWDKREEKMLVKLMDEGDDWIVFRSVNSSANPPITRHRDEIHRYGTVIMRITAEP